MEVSAFVERRVGSNQVYRTRVHAPENLEIVPPEQTPVLPIRYAVGLCRPPHEISLLSDRLTKLGTAKQLFGRYLTLNQWVQAAHGRELLTQDVLAKETTIGNSPKQRHIAELQKSIRSETAKLNWLSQNIGKVEPVVGEQPRMNH